MTLPPLTITTTTITTTGSNEVKNSNLIQNLWPDEVENCWLSILKIEGPRSRQTEILRLKWKKSKVFLAKRKKRKIFFFAIKKSTKDEAKVGGA